MTDQTANFGGLTFSQIVFSNVGSELLNLLMAEDIVPGKAPSYQTCKAIYAYHPLGKKIAEAPINLAQSQERQITVPGAPSDRLVEAFKREWHALGVVGADVLIHNTMRTSRMYGIASLVVGDRKQDPSTPLDLATIADADLFFNVLDPLNTAGSLVLNQDPNSPDFQKPVSIRAGGKDWHFSRACVMLNEQPVYIEFTTSAFGFVGRSVYQRILFPLKTYLQSMITDDMVTKKIALLIWKAKAATSAISQRILNIFAWKRQQLQGGMTGNVLQIGHEEDVQSLNFQNLEGAGKFTRENVLKNIGSGADMPAGLLDQETMVEGFGEGTEDAKQIARWVERFRVEMQPIYKFLDDIVMRRAWSPRFYEGIKRDFAEYRNVPYETALYKWINAFTAIWPNLLVEPDSERIKVEEIRFKSVVALVEVMAPLMDPENKARLVAWAAENINYRKELFSAPLEIDERLIETYAEQMKEREQAASEEADREPSRPTPFSRAS